VRKRSGESERQRKVETEAKRSRDEQRGDKRKKFTDKFPNKAKSLFFMEYLLTVPCFNKYPLFAERR
jgi:hypothetical protein